MDQYLGLQSLTWVFVEGEKKEWFNETVDIIRARFNYTTDFGTLFR